MIEEQLVVEAEEPPSTKEEPPGHSSLLLTENIAVPADKPAAHTRTRTARLRIIRKRGPVSHSRAFRARFFPGTSQRDWNDWHWQLANRITTIDQLGRFLHLSDSETSAFSDRFGTVPLSITPYYASLLDPNDPSQPLRRSMVPTLSEHIVSTGEEQDPLGEESDMPVPGLVHRYPDRVLFLATPACSAYCRYCTRSRFVGDHQGGTIRDWENSIEYIQSHKEIRDVLISGGDPLTLPDDVLDWLLGRIANIPHVEFIRIGSKMPAVLPMRITKNLVRMLRKYRPLWLSIHATHPDELTPEMRQACDRLADAGIPLGSQTVLLAGINDNVDTMKRLMQGLLTMRVRPYYLYQCDPIHGSSHFRTPVSKGIEIIEGLRGHTSGYAVPTYVIDAPGGGGKIPLLPDYNLGYTGSDLQLRNYEKRTFVYPDVKKAPIE